MQFDIFSPDFGILPSAYFQKSAITNPTELFWSDDLAALLRLCGAREETIGDRASDYDRFLALCRALPVLQGHPTRAWIASVFAKHFALQELPNEENAAPVWKMLCSLLAESPITPEDVVSGSWLCDAKILPKTLPKAVVPVLNANLLLDTTAKTLADWADEIKTAVAHFAAHKCQKIFLLLPEDYQFTAPSVYHVNRTLALPKKDRGAINLLIGQLTREICIAAQKQDILLVLACGCDPCAAVRLLQYVEATVALPRITWSLRRAREAAPLLNFTAMPHKAEMLAALSYEDALTDAELSEALDAWRVRYPEGRLCYLTARDLRQTQYAQTHIANMLQSRKQKI